MASIDTNMAAAGVCDSMRHWRDTLFTFLHDVCSKPVNEVLVVGAESVEWEAKEQLRAGLLDHNSSFSESPSKPTITLTGRSI